MPSSVASAALLAAVALALAGASATAVALICGAAVLLELFLFYLAGSA